MSRCHLIAVLTALALTTGTCASGQAASDTATLPSPTDDTATLPPPADDTAGVDRLAAIEVFVQTWATATDLATAQEAAEGARNLVVGPDGPGYGDTTADGTVNGDATDGLLPGLAGQGGIALTSSGNPCVQRDVLGGAWDDPAMRWEVLARAIESWSPSNNPFPGLPSHPQRIVGWATLTLGAEDLETAHEFAGHAQLHVDVSRDAYAC